MERTAKTYAAAIDSLNVESNYLPKGGVTHCNEFAQDVMKKMSVPPCLVV